MTTKEIAALWEVSETWVTILCKDNRIPGAIKEGGRWNIRYANRCVTEVGNTPLPERNHE